VGIDWTTFTPWSALAGGTIIGIAAVLKVLEFPDLAGQWDPSLALVMLGAIAIGAGGFAVAARRTATLLGKPMLLPTARAIDGRLVFGGVLFGVGWGLAGFCPGPAVVAVGAGYLKAMAFITAMVAGMLAFEWIEGMRPRSAARAEPAARGVSE
jgi:uncharacterized membrane protein YedE/YeeE